MTNLPVLHMFDKAMTIAHAEEWFRLDVANGDARSDTLATYMNQLSHWLEWCYDQGIDPGAVVKEDVKKYRRFLVLCEAQHATITLKLSIVRRFYQGAVDRGFILANPALGVKAPRQRKAKNRMQYLTEEEAENLLQAVSRDGGLKSKRDRAMIALMAIEGLRRVEIQRANVEDIEYRHDPAEFRILVHGKGKDDYAYPRSDCREVILDYLDTRGVIAKDLDGEPLFVSLSKTGRPLKRLSRIGISSIINEYLVLSGNKREGLSCHALRHTCGHLIYKNTKDVKVVQETLRHANLSTSAKYSHVEEKRTARYTKHIPLKP